MGEIFKNILNISNYHNNFSEEHVDLLIENSYLSDYVRVMLASSLANQCKGVNGDPRFDEGYEYVRMLEREIIYMLHQSFKLKHMEIRFPSGSSAKSALLLSMLNPGDSIVGPANRLSHRLSSIYATYQCHSLPMTADQSNIDLDAFAKLLNSVRPKLVLLGVELQLFTYPIANIARICHDYDIPLAYDLSQFLGLVLAKSFQADLFQYCDAVVSSTSGSLHAPERGLLFFNDSEYLNTINKKGFIVKSQEILSNELAGLGVALAEMTQFGAEYSKEAISNARILADYLSKKGFNVLFKERNYTENHMILIEHPDSKTAVNALGRAGILTSSHQLPSETEQRTHCIKLGTHIITRRGMKNMEILQLATAIHSVLMENEVPEIVNNRLIKPLAKNFTDSHYSYDVEFPVRYGWRSQPYETLQDVSTLDSIKTSRAFSKVSMELLTELEPYFNRINLTDKTVIFKKDDAADGLYFIAKGQIEIFDPDDNDKRIIVHLPSDHFGEYGAITRMPRRFSARAIGDVVMLKVSIDNFHSLLFALPEVKSYFEKYIENLPKIK